MKKLSKYIVLITIIMILVILLLNLYVVMTTKNKIKKIEEIDEENIDAIVVLGAGIRRNNPSPMLEDRLLTSIDLYNKEVAKKIIVSGDHGQKDYDEVNVMKNYLIKNNVLSEDVFMDHAGFSTYDSIYRAKEIFKTKKVVIVTQKYHLYRSLYIAKELDLDAYGVVADRRVYQNQTKRDIREIIARVKDLIKCIFKPESTYLGETIPVDGNGDITNDK